MTTELYLPAVHNAKIFINTEHLLHSFRIQMIRKPLSILRAAATTATYLVER